MRSGAHRWHRLRRADAAPAAPPTVGLWAMGVAFRGVAPLLLCACVAAHAAAQDADATDSISQHDGEPTQEPDAQRHDTGTADAISRGDCFEGLVLRAGDHCVYPGTDEQFRVENDGTARFLFGTFSGSVEIETSLDGHFYELAASDQSDGAWRLDRVGAGAKAQGAGFLALDHARPGRPEPGRSEPDQAKANAEGTGTGAADPPLGLSGLECRATPMSGAMAVRIEGAVHANADVSSVTVSGRVGGGLVDVKALGRLSSGNAARFVLEGLAQAGELNCAVDVEYFDLGLLRHGQPLRVEWEGSLAR